MTASEWSLDLNSALELSGFIGESIRTIDTQVDLEELCDEGELTGLWAGLVVDILSARANRYNSERDHWVIEQERLANEHRETQEWIRDNILNRYPRAELPKLVFLTDVGEYAWEYQDTLVLWDGRYGDATDARLFNKPGDAKDIVRLCHGRSDMINTVAYCVIKTRTVGESELFRELNPMYKRVEFNLWLKRIEHLPPLGPLDGVVLEQ